jgi:hypothetical protein
MRAGLKQLDGLKEIIYNQMPEESRFVLARLLFTLHKATFYTDVLLATSASLP